MRLRWLFAAAGLVLLAASLFAYRQYTGRQERETAAARLAEWELARAVQRKLELPVGIRVDKSVPESEWFAEWSRQSGIQARVITVFNDGPKDISLNLPRIPARAAIQNLVQFDEYRWNLKGDDLTIGTGYDPRSTRYAQFYPLPLHVARLPAAERHELLGVVSRIWFGLHSYCVAYHDQDVPGGIIARGFADEQQAFASLLLACEQIAAHGSRQPIAVPDDPHWEPFALGDDAAALRDLLRKLDEPVSLNLVDVPFAEFAREIETQSGIRLCLDPALNTGAEFSPLPKITCQATDLPLQAVLELVLGDQGLSWMPMPGGASLFVARLDQQNLQAQQKFKDALRVPLAYPMQDLNGSRQRKGTAHELAHVISIMVQHQPWYDNSRPSSVQVWGDYLIAPLTLTEHFQVRDLIRALRRVRSGVAGPAVRAGFDNPHSERLLSLYEKPIILACRGEPLAQVIAELRNEHGLPIYLSSRIASVPVEPRQPVWCHLPAAPTRVNLAIMLRSLSLDCEVRPTYLLVTPLDSQVPTDQQFAVWDVRSLTGQRVGLHDPGRIEHFLDTALYPFPEPAFRRELPKQRVGGLLVLQQADEELRAADRLFRLARSGLQSNPGNLHGEALNQPLPIRLPGPLDEARLVEKLKQRETVQVQVRPLREILYELVEKHDLPYAPTIVPDGSVNFETLITYEAKSLPLADILQQLIESASVGRWDTSAGYLQITTVPQEEETEESVFKSDHKFHVRLYFVGDLVAPRGRHSLPDLTARIETDITKISAAPGFDFTYFEANPYFDSFLLINCRPSHVETIATTLRTLRHEVRP